MEAPKKYVPGPNDPELPPQLSEFKDKSADEIFEELNRMPFFMTQLDETDGEGGVNDNLEALKALAYEGEPHEIAGNFKNRGNEFYKLKQYRDAREVYTKGIDVKCDDDKINESLYANRAACELELKNFRKCIEDCKKALSFNVKNIKCYYRMGKAFLSVDRFDESKESIEFGLKIDSENKSLKNLLQAIEKRQLEIQRRKDMEMKIKLEKEGKKVILENAMKLRNITMIGTSNPVDLLKEGKLKLEDPLDFESQLIFPALIMYPTLDEFDFVAEVGELTTVGELLDVIFDRPQQWFEIKGHDVFQNKNKVLAYMETQSGGLVKIGRKNSFHEIFKMEKLVIPMFDNSLKIFFVPKSESEAWLAKWDKTKAIERRL
ncbi:hypothetical protein TBLA_0H03380 [Henningerozyma blattae CBS 6284]|uniref:Cns1/TTC4 wheel domain-containing protein n=1 Tax=Henningerozyma blattae (strain ATCC 34711 / CBS 6284 / DSM 70876 / NBRC 10599 / NRRL Y-10934 / UCD 77-7) TaxID=1071380 RepID=I2H8B7_HENB6|nr:hypothetical protein TBLA_0H03380 [Tetrapisispora blattae CBS 6284]CCH62619.1 hypothetical protein TBLA_0H03380 [Tetrapisispora blattae CBS 6284]